MRLVNKNSYKLVLSWGLTVVFQNNFCALLLISFVFREYTTGLRQGGMQADMDRVTILMSGSGWYKKNPMMYKVRVGM